MKYHEKVKSIQPSQDFRNIDTKCILCDSIGIDRKSDGRPIRCSQRDIVLSSFVFFPSSFSP